jgi:hypothetical protein
MLDYWVAKAEGLTVRLSEDKTHAIITRSHGGPIPRLYHESYIPSARWHDGGPLIEKHEIGFVLCDSPRGTPGQPYVGRFYRAFVWDRTDMQSGKTHLEAAMRMIVSHKYGPKVPDESL